MSAIASRGIRINAVCPGTIDTPMVADMLAKELKAVKVIMRDQPTGRLGRTEEIASAVLWLCSPGASFVIGQALAVDGGYTPPIEDGKLRQRACVKSLRRGNEDCADGYANLGLCACGEPR